MASRETRYSIRAARGYGPRDCHEFTRRGFCCTCRSPTAQARPGPPSPCQLWRDLFVSSVTGGRRVQTERHWLTYYDQRWSNQLKLRWSISIWRSTRLVRCRAGGIMTIQTDNRLHGCWPTRTRLWLNWWNPVSPPDGSGHTDELAPNSSWLPATYLRAPIKEPVLLVGSGGLHAGDSLPEEARRFGEFVQLSRDTAALKISSPRQRHRRQRPRGQRPLQRPWRSLSRCRACSKKAPPTCRRGAVLKRFRRARDALGSILIPE